VEQEHYKEICSILFDNGRRDLIHQLERTNGWNTVIERDQLKAKVKELEAENARLRGLVAEHHNASAMAKTELGRECPVCKKHREREEDE